MLKIEKNNHSAKSNKNVNTVNRKKLFSLCVSLTLSYLCKDFYKKHL